MTQTHKIPLFPLGLVMLPDMLLPLHIFEDRYKQMILECTGEDKPFGIVLFDGQSIRSVGCMARITKVIKRYDDGRMDIMTRGSQRFVNPGYLVGCAIAGLVRGTKREAPRALSGF